MVKVYGKLWVVEVDPPSHLAMARPPSWGTHYPGNPPFERVHGSHQTVDSKLPTGICDRSQDAHELVFHNFQTSTLMSLVQFMEGC